MYKALQLRSIIKVFAKALNPLFAALEPWYFRKYHNECSRHCPVFIIAAPRTGSTILYQILTNSNELLYIDNLASPFYKTMPFGICLSQLIFKNKSHKSFQSNYGNTSSLHAPSESQSFWFRWFPRDRDFVDVEDINPETIQDLQKTITAMMNHHEKDIIFKNLACGQRIRVLRHAFPNAKFIFLKRDPRFTAQSLLLARRNLKMQDSVWWSVKPQNYKALNDLPIHEKLIEQICRVEEQIEADIKSIPEKNRRDISYEDIPARLPDLVAFLGLKDGLDVDLNAFKFTNEIKASKTDWTLIETAYKKTKQTEGH